MNQDRIKQAFEAWWKENFSSLIIDGGLRKMEHDALSTWLAACEWLMSQEVSQLKAAVLELSEALESIAFFDESEAITGAYWNNIELKSKLCATLANDTLIARETLARYEELLKQIKESK